MGKAWSWITAARVSCRCWSACWLSVWQAFFVQRKQTQNHLLCCDLLFRNGTLKICHLSSFLWLLTKLVDLNQYLFLDRQMYGETMFLKWIPELKCSGIWATFWCFLSSHTGSLSGWKVPWNERKLWKFTIDFCVISKRDRTIVMSDDPQHDVLDGGQWYSFAVWQPAWDESYGSMYFPVVYCDDYFTAKCCTN